jgi:hypothetical protein
LVFANRQRFIRVSVGLHLRRDEFVARYRHHGIHYPLIEFIPVQVAPGIKNLGGNGGDHFLSIVLKGYFHTEYFLADLTSQ